MKTYEEATKMIANVNETLNTMNSECFKMIFYKTKIIILETRYNIVIFNEEGKI